MIKKLLKTYNKSSGVDILLVAFIFVFLFSFINNFLKLINGETFGYTYPFIYPLNDLVTIILLSRLFFISRLAWNMQNIKKYNDIKIWLFAVIFIHSIGGMISVGEEIFTIIASTVLPLLCIMFVENRYKFIIALVFYFLLLANSFVFVRLEGQIYFLMFSFQIVMFSVIGLMFRDKTILTQKIAQEQAEAKIIIANAEASERANKHKTSFLADMSHELRGPLNSMTLASYHINNAGPLNEKQKKHHATIERNIEHLLQLINTLLDLEKIEAGEFIINPTNDNIIDIIRSVIDEDTIASTKGLDIIFDRPHNLPSVWIDGLLIKRVLQNLLTNAIKYTSSGEIIFSLDQQDSMIRVSIRDTGQGIEQSAMERIFVRYRQANPGEDQQRGTGLGLPISKHLVEMHGGTLWAESVFGKGSTFYFTIPVAD